MSFCPNCGSEINEGALFCGNCGQKTQNEVKSNNSLKTGVNIDLKRITNAAKEYFLNFYVDYNSKFFKFAMILFMAVGIGTPLYELICKFLPSKVFELFTGVGTVISFLVCAILFGIFSIFIMRIKEKSTVKKSNSLMIFWIVAVVLNLLVFLADINLYEYILYSNYASNSINILMVVSSAVLLLKNKPKYPFVLMISALSIALNYSSKWSLKLDINLYKILPSVNNLLDVLDSLSYIIIVIIVFALMYLVPRKISKWMVIALAAAAVVLKAVRIFASFDFLDIITIVEDTAIKIGRAHV